MHVCADHISDDITDTPATPFETHDHVTAACI